jgi:DNA-directed RNA polymerase specialized sigma24 family protein
MGRTVAPSTPIKAQCARAALKSESAPGLMGKASDTLQRREKSEDVGPPRTNTSRSNPRPKSQNPRVVADSDVTGRARILRATQSSSRRNASMPDTPDWSKAALRRIQSVWALHTTPWSLIEVLKQGGDGEIKAAHGALFELYQRPLLARARAKARSGEDPQDLLQGFFEYVIAKRALAIADEGRGTFRSFLAKVFDNYLHNKWDRDDAIKRGRKYPHVSIEAPDAGGPTSSRLQDRLDPEILYNQEWVRSLLEHARAQLRTSYENRGRADLFTALECFLDEPYGEEGCYKPIASALSMTESAVKKATHDLRLKLRERVRAEIAATVRDPDQVDAEIRQLLRAFETEP